MTPGNVSAPDVVEGDRWDGLAFQFTSEMANDLARARFGLRSVVDGTTLLFDTEDPDAAEKIVITESSAVGWLVEVLPQILPFAAGGVTFSLETTDADGDRKTYVQGEFEILEDPTKP